ncbi:MAG: SHOCT domain-containing protein [bacterium]
MPVRKLHALTALPLSLVLAAACRRDALLRGRGKLPSLAILGAIASLSGGCVAVGGARHSEQPTLGKQLVDLKAALDTGAITEAEYAAAKSRMLTGNP